MADYDFDSFLMMLLTVFGSMCFEQQVLWLFL